MSKIALSGNASGTGTFTIESPNTNTNYTLALPPESGTLVTSGGSGSVTTAMIANSAVTTAKIADANVTTAKLATAVQPIGVGQTFQSPSRAFNTTYTNSTGRPIALYIRVGTLTNTGATLFVDGVPVAGDSGIANTASNLPCIVPAGSTYIVSTTGTPSLSSWVELR